MARRAPQLSLDLAPTFGWGGARAGAGRKPRGREPGISHARKVEVSAGTPVHVTLRAREHVWNLRSRRAYAVVGGALRGVLARPRFRVVHFSVQGNHLHLLVEAEGAAALAGGMKALSGRIALGLNQMMGRRGRVFSDRYHAHVLRTPAEVRHALAYVLGNFASHARRRGESVSPGVVDPYSSAAPLGPDGAPPPVSAARSWLLRTGGLVAREPAAAYGPGRRSRRATSVPGVASRAGSSAKAERDSIPIPRERDAASGGRGAARFDLPKEVPPRAAIPSCGARRPCSGRRPPFQLTCGEG